MADIGLGALVSIRRPSTWGLIASPFALTALLYAFGPSALRASFAKPLRDITGDAWVTLLSYLVASIVMTCVGLLLGRGIYLAFKRASQIDDARNAEAIADAEVGPATVPDPDVARFAAMDDAERRALGLFIGAGFKQISGLGLKRFGHDIPRALERLQARGYVKFQRSQGTWILERRYFAKLSECPELIGLTIQPRKMG